MNLNMETAKTILAKYTTEPHLFTHAIAVSGAMGAMARHFGEDEELWRAVGYLHDVDYEQYPEEHLQHTEEMLSKEGIAPEFIRAILSHGYSICTDVLPETNLEKSLFIVDELTGIIHACARMRPLGITDLTVKSVMKKFKDKKFAAGCDRALITKGAEMLGMDVPEVTGLCIEGMKPFAAELGLLPKAD